MKQSMLSRGFTLIELLVVIAIIGILAAVVLGSLNDARDGGQDASIKQSMGNIRSQAELYYNQTNFSYSGVCTTPTVTNLLAAVDANRSETIGVDVAYASAAAVDRVTCHDSPSGYAAMAPLNTGTSTSYWCVDSDGAAGLVPRTQLGASDVGCAAGIQ